MHLSCWFILVLSRSGSKARVQRKQEQKPKISNNWNGRPWLKADLNWKLERSNSQLKIL